MSTRVWWTGVAVVVGLASGAASAPAPVDPATLVGVWSGKWENKSFIPHPIGSVNATITQPNADIVAIDYNASGGVFGQCTVSPTTLTLVKGVDFTDTALTFSRQDPTFGT